MSRSVFLFVLSFFLLSCNSSPPSEAPPTIQAIPSKPNPFDNLFDNEGSAPAVTIMVMNGAGEITTERSLPSEASSNDIQNTVRQALGAPTLEQEEAATQYVTEEELGCFLAETPTIVCGIVRVPRTRAYLDAAATLWDGNLYHQYVVPIIGMDDANGTLASLVERSDGQPGYKLIYFRVTDIAPNPSFVDDLARYDSGFASTAPTLCPDNGTLPDNPQFGSLDNLTSPQGI